MSALDTVDLDDALCPRSSGTLRTFNEAGVLAAAESMSRFDSGSSERRGREYCSRRRWRYVRLGSDPCASTRDDRRHSGHRPRGGG